MPKIRRQVLRGPPYYDFIGISGRRKGGKTTTAEQITSYYYEAKKYIALALWGAQDRENAFYCIGDVYYVFWNSLPGKAEFKLGKFCRKKLGLDWVNFTKDPTIKKLVRHYTIEKINDNIVLLTSKANPGDYLKMIYDAEKNRVTLEYAKAGAVHKADYDVSKDGYGNIRIHFPNPNRNDNKARTVGYPVVIIISPHTKIVQFDPLCVCGKPIRDHPQNVKDAPPNPDYPCKLVNMYLIKTVPDTTPVEEIMKLAMKERRIVVLNRGFYSYDERFRPYEVVYEFLRKIPYIVNDKVIPTNVSIILTLLELSSIVPQGMKAWKGQAITEIKRSMQDFLKEARHFRTSIVADYQAGADVLAEVLDKRDYLIMKNSTEELIPDNFKWFYKEVVKQHYRAADGDGENPYPLLENLKPWQAYVIFPEGKPAYELRQTQMPKVKHKEPFDDWETLANCQIVHDVKAITGTPDAGKKAKPQDTLRQRALIMVHEKLQKDPSLEWDQLAKDVGFIDKKTKKVASGNALRMAYGRWVRAKVQSEAGAADPSGTVEDYAEDEDDGDDQEQSPPPAGPDITP